MIVDLDGLVFNTYEPDGNGTFWYVTGLDGWDSPGLRQTVAEPTSRHGDVLAKSLLGPRPMTLRGIVKSTTLDGHYLSQQQLQGQANNIAVTKPFRVTEDIQREVKVYRAGHLRMSPAGLRAFSFELPLTAPDPLKYAVQGTTVTINSNQTKTVTNDGNFVTERYLLTALATGHVRVANLTISELGIRTDQEVENGTTFNCLARSVRDPDGLQVYSSLSPASTWWGLQPGDNQVHNKGGVNVSMTYFPAWL